MLKQKNLLVGVLHGALVLGMSFALSSSDASAQRRVIGGEQSAEDEEDEDAQDEKAVEKKKKAEEKAKKKAEKKAKKEAKKKAKAEEKKRKAQEAAEKAAEEAEERKEKAAEAKKQAAIEKEQARLDANAKSREKRAKAFRRISRADQEIELAVTLKPGAPKPNKVVELRFDITRRLKVASVKYGNLEPQRKAKVTVEVTPPEADDETEATTYRAHALGTPGAYGVHFTPDVEGAYKVTVKGVTAKGEKFSTGFAVYPGVWPPPDLEDEAKENKKAKDRGATASGRRVVGG